MKGFALLLIGIVAGMTIGYLCNGFRPPQEPTVVVQTVRDTITEYVPRLVQVAPPHNAVTARLPLANIRRDTLPDKNNRMSLVAEVAPQDEADEELTEPPDSADVVVPISQKTFEGANFRAYVSGFNQTLDSISIYAERQIVTQYIPVAAKRKRWGVGVTAGYGYTPRGFQPYVGVGISYSILSF